MQAGDGKLDLAFLSWYPPSSNSYQEGPSCIFVYSGDGNGAFATPVQAGCFTHAYTDFCVVDVDGDGRPDPILRIASSLNNYVLGVVNNLDGHTFGPEINYTVTVTAAPTTLTVASANNPSPALAPVMFTACLALPTGMTTAGSATISFFVDGAVTANVPADNTGTAMWTASGFTAGTHTVSAKFSGDTQRFASRSGTISQVAYTNATFTTLTAAPNPSTQNQPVTLLAPVAALTGTVAPAGTVQFSEGAAVLAVELLQMSPTGRSASAISVTTTLSPGTHIITTAYVPGTNAPYLRAFAGSAPAVLTVIVQPQSFSIKPSSPTLTIQTGHHGSLDIALLSVGGLTGQFTLTCGSLPAVATCAFTQPTLSLPASGTGTTTLTIDTDAVIGFRSSLNRSSLHWPVNISIASLFPLGLLAFAKRRRRGATLVCLWLLAVASLRLSASSSKYPAHTPPGTYLIHLQATGTLVGSTTSQTQTANLTLVITE